MAVFSVVRLITLIFTVVFAIIVLGLCAHITALTIQDIGGYFPFAVLGIATAVLTITSVPVMIVVDLLRSGAFTSKVVVELAWLSILWILWLSTGATAANANHSVFPTGCGFIDPTVNSDCHQFFAVEGFAFLTWIILMIYTIALLISTIMAGGDGSPVWNNSVKEDSNPARTGNNAVAEKTGLSGPNGIPSSPPQYPSNTAAQEFTGTAQYPPNTTAREFSATAQYPPGSMAPQYLPGSVAPQYPPGSAAPAYGDHVPQPTPAPQLPQSSPYPQV